MSPFMRGFGRGMVLSWIFLGLPASLFIVAIGYARNEPIDYVTGAILFAGWLLALYMLGKEIY